MRNFRFRLEPVIRLKKYNIERKEEEIASIDDEINRKLAEIENGRKAIEEQRRILLEETPDQNLVNAERNFDYFRTYTTQVEAEIRQEITKLEQEKDEKQKELIQFYQEDKILERLKEQRRQEWQKEAQKEEDALMDELGTMRYVRRSKEFGGILLYLLVPLALAAAGAGIGFYTGVIDKELLQEVPYVKELPYFSETVESATQVVPNVVSATPEIEYYTVRDYLADPDTPMPELLQNLHEERQRLLALQNQLAEREKAVTLRENILQEREEQVSSLIKDASDHIQTLRELERLREERIKSEASEREEELAGALSKGKTKEIAPILISLFQSITETDEEKIKQNKMLVLRLLHRFQARGLQELFAIMGKNDPITAAQIIQAYDSTSTDEMYGIIPPTPTPTPLPPLMPSAQEEPDTTAAAG